MRSICLLSRPLDSIHACYRHNGKRSSLPRLVFSLLAIAGATPPAPLRAAILQTAPDTLSSALEDDDQFAPLAPEAPQKVTRFSINRQPMHDAVVNFARQASLQIAWRAEDFRGLEAGPVHGEMTPEEALSELLGPLNAAYIFTSEKVVAITAPPQQTATAVDTDGLQQSAAATTSPRAFEPYSLPDRDEITVTGTRLNTLAEDSRFAPQHALSTRDIRRSGYNDFLNAIADLPTVNAPTTPENTQTSLPSSGQSFIELRGLSANRTLILLDGRRTVSSSYTSNRVDLNTIPLDLVKRVEFVKGGASAVYGADAIAGAVNIIFDNDFEGMRLKTRGGLSQQGGGEEIGASLLYGKNMNDGRSRITLYAGFDHEGAIRATDRDFATISAEFDPRDNELDTPDFSNTIPGGRFLRPGPDFFFDETGLRDDYSSDENGFAFRPLTTLSIPQERYYASALLNQSLASNVELFSSTHWNLVSTETTRAPETLSDLDTDFLIPLDNPFVPDEIRQDALSRGDEGIRFRRRLSELGNRMTLVDRSTFRHWTGVRGASDDNAFNWEITAGYSRHHQDQSRRGIIIIPKFIDALTVEADPDNTASFRCLSADARAQGCTPINIFGLDTITPEAADFIRHPDNINATIEQYTLSAVASGKLATLPAGNLDVAIGAEARHDRLRVRTDAINASNDTSATQIVPFGGKHAVFDIFSEVRLPLFNEHTLARSLSLHGASRLTVINEGTEKLGVSYNFNASWKPVSSVKFNVGYSQSIREPDLSERFSPPRGDSDSFSDPCDNVTTTTDTIAGFTCRADTRVGAVIAAEGQFEQIGSTISGPNAGNRDLTFETAKTLSARFSAAPDLPLQPKLIVEYFNIKVDDAIEAFSSTQIARECYRRSDAGRDRFCDLITRNNAGQVIEIINPQLNLIRLESAGVESELSLKAPFQLSGVNGDFHLTARHSRMLKLEESFDSPLNNGFLDDDLNEPGAAKNTAQFLGHINWGSFSGRWRSQYISPTIDSDSRIELFAEEGITDPLFFNIPASWRHDLYLEWRPIREDIAVFTGINNLLNDTGPFFPSGTIQGGSDNHISEFDVVGRFFFAGVEKTF